MEARNVSTRLIARDQSAIHEQRERIVMYIGVGAVVVILIVLLLVGVLR